MTLRIGHISTFYHTAILLMKRRDLIERLGIDVEWRLFGTGPAIVDAFGREELDLAYIGLPPAIIGIGRGTDIVCIAGGHMEGTVITGKKDFVGFPEEQDLAVILGQLKGKRIG
ncbi:MAG: ABC transporter substrate-binding protein, partial [Nitrospirae bacterium]|nr:ABC transporter substrate-binding protein [Nitrospirota bacterium]